MRYAARFVVETHAHITTVYNPKGKPKGVWTGLPKAPEDGEAEPYDNSPLCLYDMERYGVDMCLLKPSVPGTTNEAQAALVEKYPDKFRAFCSDQTLKIKSARGEAKWSLDAAAEEVETALKTGKFIGIGEFVPRNTDRKKVYTFKERLEEYRTFMELAEKYNVTIDFHDFAWGYDWDSYALLQRIAVEYPKVPVIFCHGGYSIGSYPLGTSVIQKACSVASRLENIYLETGTWTADCYEIALKDPNVGPTQLLWGGDYGQVPQYITAHQGQSPSSYTTAMKRWPLIPTYQIDWWGWALHQIDKIRDYVTQDEINLILGGNAAKLFKLPVPYAHMFPEGRPDLWGIHWEKSVPFIPKDQIRNP
jgi:predicted TIM-barrel fold metal-dependent hydrolase